MHQDAIGAHADLTLVGEAAEDCGVESQLEIGILQHDHGAISSQLENHFFQTAAGDFSDFASAASCAGEGNHAGDWMIDELVAEIADVRDDYVQQSFRNSRVFKNTSEQRAASDRSI